MGDLFGGGKAKPPKVQKVAPPPTITTESEDWALKQAAKNAGWSKTIITGDLVPTPKKKTVMG